MSILPPPPPGPGPSWPPPAPQPGWGPPPGDGPHSPAPLNGFALASLLVGLLCLPPLGVVFAAVALVQAGRRRQRGRALAVVGLVVSLVTTAVLAVTAGQFAGSVRERLGALGGSAEGDLTDLDDLRQGDCFNVPRGDLLADRPRTYAIDCARVHDGEVTASQLLEQADEPGSAGAVRAAEEACWKAQDGYAMDTWALPADARMYYFAPSRRSWRLGDRRLLCVIGTTDQERRGSLRQDRDMLGPEQSAFLEAANAVEFAIGRPPEGDLDEALAEHRAWAREVDSALGDEAKVLEGHRARPGMEQAVRARLREIEAARAAWQRSSRARTAAEFDREWDGALGALSVETEKALRGAYGLATEVPQWLEESPGGPGNGPGNGPGGGPGNGAGRGPSSQAA
ncbi:DUF4190 domain-containing protein [Streptomyces sp. CB00455]|uniref:DUF4190 domain-containing protein n=1 Tax=Streptomyces sp. CB00455 TaxID=1703927 RepID=UPI0009A0EC7D|nr:DUF4190 domain-containing protein [Streptomyces sp. CB00455]